MLLADIDDGLLDLAERLVCIAVAIVPVRMYLVVGDGYTSTLKCEKPGSRIANAAFSTHNSDEFILEVRHITISLCPKCAIGRGMESMRSHMDISKTITKGNP